MDTHVWLWSVVSPERITPVARDLLENPENALILSVASSWEIAIKYRIGKLPLPEPPAVFIQPRLTRDGIESLPIERKHSVYRCGAAGHTRIGVLRDEGWEDSGGVRTAVRRRAGAR